MLQDSRFEVSKNGTLRINSVEVYDGTWYRCVSSTPAGSIEAQARVQVLGELLEKLEGVVGSEGLEVWWGEGKRTWSLCMLHSSWLHSTHSPLPPIY